MVIRYTSHPGRIHVGFCLFEYPNKPWRLYIKRDKHPRGTRKCIAQPITSTDPPRGCPSATWNYSRPASPRETDRVPSHLSEYLQALGCMPCSSLAPGDTVPHHCEAFGIVRGWVRRVTSGNDHSLVAAAVRQPGPDDAHNAAELGAVPRFPVVAEHRSAAGGPCRGGSGGGKRGPG